MRDTAVAVINAWGQNRGDEAMLRALVRAVDAQSRDARVAVFSRGYLDLPAGICQYDWRDMAPAPLWRRTARKVRRWRQTRLMEDRQRRRQALAFLSDSDLVVSAPAGPYIGDMYPAHEDVCLSNIRKATDSGKPCVIAATSAGPFVDSERNRVRQECLEAVQWWTIREPISYHAARKAGFGLDIELCADLVFADDVGNKIASLARETRSENDANGLSQLMEFLTRPTIGVSITTTTYIDARGKPTPLDARSYLRSFAELLKAAVRTSSAQLLFFPHHYGQRREMELLAELQAALPGEVNSRIVPPAWNSDWQQYYIGKCVAYISNRYHPTIFSLKAGIPVLAIVHQFKTAGLLEQIHYPVKMPSTMQPAEIWIRGFQEIWRERASLRGHIASELPRLQRLARTTTNKLGSML